MKVVRNVAIIALLALVVAVAPGGGNAAEGVLTAITLAFLTLIGLAGRELFGRYRLDYIGLTDGQRALFVGSLGALVLMIAGAAEMTDTGAGLMVWVAIVAFSVISLVRVWSDARSAR